MTLESNKILGGLGSILLLIGILPVIGSYSYGILGLVGVIMILVALRGFSNLYNEKGIFSNAIYALVVGIVGAVVTAIIAVFAVLSNLDALENFLLQIFPTWTKGDWRALSGMSPTVPSNIDFSPLSTLIAEILVAVVVFIVFAIVAMYFFRRSLKQLSVKTAVGLFSTAGLILFIGAFLLILFIIPGLIAIYIGIIVLIIAFFQIKPQPEQPPATAMSSQPLTPTPV